VGVGRVPQGKRQKVKGKIEAGTGRWRVVGGGIEAAAQRLVADTRSSSSRK
jgi:hypothetical protein